MTEELSETPDGAVVVHEPYGFVHLQAHLASDLDVVNCARVSFRKQSEWVNFAEWDTAQANEDYEYKLKLNDADEGLIKFLMRGKHGTPFEQNFFRFHIRAPIFVFREWHRHRIGISINEESARYVQLKPHFYLPDDEHVRVQHGKPGAYTYEAAGREPIEGGLRSLGSHVRGGLENSYLQAYRMYENLMWRGVAKEIARACLPVAIYSQQIWACNARSLMNFLSLRNHPKALQELRDYANVMEAMFADLMPVTHAAFIENGRVAP